MNVLYFLRDITDCGGIQQTTCNTINSLLKDTSKDIIIHIVSLYHKNDIPFFELDKKVQYIALFDRYVNQHKDYFRIKRRLKEKLHSLTFDILIIQATVLAVFIPKNIWSEKKVIVCEHGHYDMGSVVGFHSFGKKIALKRASAIVTLTSLDLDNYKKNSKRSVKIVNIYNAYQPIKRTIQYENESKTIVSCGSLDELKRFDHAVLAAKEVHNIHPDWRWEIFGEGKQRDNLQKLINENSLQNIVILKGYEKDKLRIYGRKSFLVLTSKFEGFGMVLIEAMQYGLPLVSYDVKYGPKEIICEGVNGMLTEDGDVHRLAMTIIKMINDSAQRKRMSANCVGVLEKFSIEKTTKQWVQLFEELINGVSKV